MSILIRLHPFKILIAIRRRLNLRLQVIQSKFSNSFPGNIQNFIYQEIVPKKEDVIQHIVSNLQSAFFIRWSEKEFFLSEYFKRFSERFKQQIISQADEIAVQKLNILGSGIKKVGV